MWLAVGVVDGCRDVELVTESVTAPSFLLCRGTRRDLGLGLGLSVMAYGLWLTGLWLMAYWLMA